ncbi:MAG: hypothetical protein BRD28_00360 [Bacteroidetes bacterium QH_10_64_37]|nr:MAG: hypothetical protein BRD28_00360 [Bacteroidetes bacterium QH_10_64_37]
MLADLFARSRWASALLSARARRPSVDAPDRHAVPSLDDSALRSAVRGALPALGFPAEEGAGSVGNTLPLVLSLFGSLDGDPRFAWLMSGCRSYVPRVGERGGVTDLPDSSHEDA